MGKSIRRHPKGRSVSRFVFEIVFGFFESKSLARPRAFRRAAPLEKSGADLAPLGPPKSLKNRSKNRSKF